MEEESKEGTNDGKYMTEKQKKIAELRKQLLAPQKKGAGPIGKKLAGKDDADPMDKFKRVMDWGTPRLVTKNR